MAYFDRLVSAYDFARPVLDVLLLAFLIYKSYEFLVKTQAIQLARGAGLFALVFGAAYILKLDTLSWLINIMAPGFLVALAIVFQPELRKIIITLGLAELFKQNRRPGLGQLEAAVTAAEILSGMRRGMLIVFPRRTNVKDIIDTGTRIGGEISSTLIVSLFQFDGPLHDGAMVIQNGRVEAAGCFLPLSGQQDIKKSFGTRHRAALGVSEQTDALALVVSEETGAVSIACDGELFYDLSPAEIEKKLRALMDSGGFAGLSEDLKDENARAADETAAARRRGGAGTGGFFAER